MQVHRARYDLDQYLRCCCFDRRDLFAHLAVVLLVLVDEPGGIQHVQAVLHHHGVGIGNFFLGHLLVSQQFPFSAAAQRALTHHVDGLANNADSSHRVVDATTAESCLRNMKTLSLVP